MYLIGFDTGLSVSRSGGDGERIDVIHDNSLWPIPRSFQRIILLDA